MTVSDTFNRADSATSLGTADSGQVWSALSGTWGISSNKAYNVSAGSQQIAVVDAGSADIDMSVDLTIGAAADVGWVFRVADDNNNLIVVVAPTTIAVWKRQSGGFTNLSGNTTISSIASSTHTFRTTAIGANITVYLDGVSTLTHTLSGADQTTFGSNTKLGLRYASGAGVRWDNLSETHGTVVNVDTPGAITWTGQSVSTVISTRVSPGAIVWAGQTIVIVSTQPAAGYQGEAGLPRFPGDNVNQKRLLRWP